MAKTPTSQAQEVHVRPGVDPLTDAGWAGVNTEDDPVSLRINELQRGQNIRRSGKHLVSRPGLIHKIDLTSCAGYPPGSVMLLAELPVISSPLSLWMSCRGNKDGSPDTGAAILLVEATASPTVRPYARITAIDNRHVPLTSFGSKLVGGDGNVLREFVRPLVFPGSETARVPGLPSVCLYSLSRHVIRCLLEYDGKLFVGWENLDTPTLSKVTVWDGVQMLDDLTEIDPPVAFGIWRNRLICALDEVAGGIKVRDPGVAPGTWTTVTVASFSCSSFGNAIQEYGPYTFIASGKDRVWRFNGTTLTSAHQVSGPVCAMDGYGVTGLTLHKGLLFYIWNEEATSDYDSYLGRHDLDSTATAWIDEYKPISSEISDFRVATALSSYRGQIYIAGRNQWLIATDHSDILEVLETVNDAGPQYGVLTDFASAQLLRF